MSGEARKKAHVAIIGAGITGLLTAQALKKNGFGVTVFEKDLGVDSRNRDWTILIHWAMPTLAKLLPEDVVKEMPKSICNPHLEFTEEVETIPAFNGITGDVIFKLPNPGGRRISRKRLREVLMAGLDVKWGKQLAHLDSDSGEVIHLTFSDGDTFETIYVLGADGPASKVREALVGADAAKPLPSGHSIAMAAPKYRDTEKVKFVLSNHPVTSLFFHTTGVGVVGPMEVDDPDDPSTWTCFWSKVIPGALPSLQGHDAIDFVKGSSEGLCDPFQSAFQWTPSDSPCFLDEMRYWAPEAWDNHSGRVTLAGDAAHSMLPHRGQGLNHSIMDSEKYLEALLQIDDHFDAAKRMEAMAVYDADVIERGAKAARQSLEEAKNALDIKTVERMLMVRQGLAKTA